MDLSAEEVIEAAEEPTPTMEAREEGLLTSFEELGGDVRRIAIVEDDEPARVLLRRILQAYGDFEIFEAADGRQGIEMIRQVMPDVVLLDLMMPEVDGYQVLETIKSDPKLQHIPVIVITAARLSSQERKRLDGHVRSLLQKGQFVDRELLESIQAMF
ncbi:MAG: response regulator [Ardenticatenia bacterium]|nr:response regulator [Ardenticatenia bacterium]